MTHTQESLGRKTTKAIFHARGVGHQEKSEPLCMTCQIAEARKCLGRGLRCEPGTAHSPKGTRPSMCACYRRFSERGPEASAGRPPHPPPSGRDELVTRPWLDCLAPGREPGCPEMSPGNLRGSVFFSLLVVWAGGSPESLSLRPILMGAGVGSGHPFPLPHVQGILRVSKGQSLPGTGSSRLL